MKKLLFILLLISCNHKKADMGKVFKSGNWEISRTVESFIAIDSLGNYNLCGEDSATAIKRMAKALIYNQREIDSLYYLIGKLRDSK